MIKDNVCYGLPSLKKKRKLIKNLSLCEKMNLFLYTQKREIDGVMGMGLAHIEARKCLNSKQRSFKKILIHLAKNEYLKNTQKKISLKMQK